MSPCLIIGDSIAIGIAAALNALQPIGCDISARIGASAAAISLMVPPTTYRAIIISGGSNDRENRELDRDLERLRGRLPVATISWIYPRNPAGAWSVYRVARRHGDRSVDLTEVGSRDGVHPRDYVAAALLVLGVRFGASHRPDMALRASGAVSVRGSGRTCLPSEQIGKRDLTVK